MSQQGMGNRLSWIVTAIGSVNWGLVGLARVDLVRMIFGKDTVPARIAYGLVGLAGVWSVVHLLTDRTRARELVRR